MEHDDVGVVEGRDRSRFALKAVEPLGILGKLGWQHLQGHEATELCILGRIHRTHPAAAQLADDPVMVEFRVDQKGPMPWLNRKRDGPDLILFDKAQRSCACADCRREGRSR